MGVFVNVGVMVGGSMATVGMINVVVGTIVAPVWKLTIGNKADLPGSIVAAGIFRAPLVASAVRVSIEAKAVRTARVWIEPTTSSLLLGRVVETVQLRTEKARVQHRM